MKEKKDINKQHTILWMFPHAYLLKHDDRWKVEHTGQKVEATSVWHAHHNVFNAICRGHTSVQITSSRVLSLSLSLKPLSPTQPHLTCVLFFSILTPYSDLTDG